MAHLPLPPQALLFKHSSLGVLQQTRILFTHTKRLAD
jgi:hypothetical protein